MFMMSDMVRTESAGKVYNRDIHYAAEVLGVSEGQLRGWCRMSKIRWEKNRSGQYRFNDDDLAEVAKRANDVIVDD
jgi:predicted site-specific integrase-resolvase